jgi:hypothetical protein
MTELSLLRLTIGPEVNCRAEVFLATFTGIGLMLSRVLLRGVNS